MFLSMERDIRSLMGTIRWLPCLGLVRNLPQLAAITSCSHSSGAPILMDYRETIGASRDRGLLPTGNAVDVIDVQGEKVPITVGDTANLVVFVNAEHMGISGHETAENLTENRALLDRVREVRGKGAQMVGMYLSISSR